LQLAQQSAELIVLGYGSMIAEAGFSPIDLKVKAPITRLRAFHHGKPSPSLTTVNSCRADMD